MYLDYISHGWITKEVINKLDEEGFLWVSLARGAIPATNDHFWAPKQTDDFAEFLTANKHLTNNSPLDNWLFKFSSNVIIKISYWKAFFEEFKVKINLDTQEVLLIIADIYAPGNSKPFPVIDLMYSGRKSRTHQDCPNG